MPQVLGLSRASQYLSWRADAGRRLLPGRRTCQHAAQDGDGGRDPTASGAGALSRPYLSRAGSLPALLLLPCLAWITFFF